METHESLTSREPVPGSSDRGFGIVFAIAFTVIGLFPLLDGGTSRYGSLVLAGVILAMALVKSEWLAPFNKVWFKIGLLLHRIVHPVVMALLFYAVVTPTGLIMRALGKDLLRLRYDRNTESYWIHRSPPRGPTPDSMKNQF